MTKTKINWDEFKPIPGFDCVKLKNDIQAKLYEETKNMTQEEFLEYVHKGSEKFWAEYDRYQQQYEGTVKSPEE